MAYALLMPRSLLLLDEATSELDMFTRCRLFDFLKIKPQMDRVIFTNIHNVIVLASGLCSCREECVSLTVFTQGHIGYMTSALKTLSCSFRFLRQCHSARRDL